VTNTGPFLRKVHIIARWCGPARLSGNGVFDVVVAGHACMAADLASEAARVDTRSYGSVAGVAGLVDKTDYSVDKDSGGAG